MDGHTLTYGQTEILLLFGKVMSDGNTDLKDFTDMKASAVGLEMMKAEAFRMQN